jgi:hypothetical protein
MISNDIIILVLGLLLVLFNLENIYTLIEENLDYG